LPALHSGIIIPGTYLSFFALGKQLSVRQKDFRDDPGRGFTLLIERKKVSALAFSLLLVRISKS